MNRPLVSCERLWSVNNNAHTSFDGMHVNLYEDEDGGGYWYHGMHDCPYFLTNDFVLYQNNSAPKEINE